MPVTFYVEVQDPTKDQNYAAAMQPFINFYSVLEQNKRTFHEL